MYCQEEKHIKGYREVMSMSRELLKGLIDLIDESDTETIFRILVRFVPEEKVLPDEQMRV